MNLSYVDYSAIDFDETKLNTLITNYDLSTDNVDYSNILVSMFCEYITGIEKLPLKTVSRKPAITKTDDVYAVLTDEDVFLDKELFSSDELADCEMRFTEAIGNILTEGNLEVSKEWTEWDELAKVKKESTTEPLKYGKLTMTRNWCGAYYLMNDYYTYDENGNKTKEDVTPQLGDGSFNSPASIGTPVISCVLVKDSKGKVKELPIKVEMTEFGCSEDAITWFQSKHIQNRGYILDSEVQYCYYVFKITNLSSETVTVKDNASLCDKNGNLSTKTGTVFGLSESITLKPDETGYIESWGRSTELNKKYVIWGADFDKKVDSVWFRVLAGDLEDKSEDKGVYQISRTDDEKDVEETVAETTKSAN